MNAPLASLVRWRVLDCAKHSARLRHALRQLARKPGARLYGRSRLPAIWRLRGMGTWLAASYWTIGPRGKLP